MGIEPTLSAWEADVLPLNYTREGAGILAIRRTGGQAAMRSVQMRGALRGWVAGSRVLANNVGRSSGWLPLTAWNLASGTRCGRPGTRGPAAHSGPPHFKRQDRRQSAVAAGGAIARAGHRQRDRTGTDSRLFAGSPAASAGGERTLRGGNRRRAGASQPACPAAPPVRRARGNCSGHRRRLSRSPRKSSRFF